ncbi:MAG TPA: 5-deoxy-glucuronate isomerase [Candidatus Xenobia bacterium]|jgi:5-deoxy-glucuronate isomerase
MTVSTQDGVTPAQAGWKYLSFQVHRLAAGQVLQGRSGDEEAVLVLLGGHLKFRLGEVSIDAPGRADVFSGLPYYGYLPRQTDWRLEAVTPCEVAWGSAPTTQDHPARLLGPKDCQVEMRGARNVERQITHLVDPGFGCHRLLCVEVYTPSGNWSSYPPHRHDAHDPPRQVKLEEVYYYRMAPDGFAFQRLYGGSTDQVVMAKDRDVVLVRDGYHPVVAGPGYDIYYLNLLAGDHPSWAAADDPDVAWVRGVWNSPQPLSLPMHP